MLEIIKNLHIDQPKLRQAQFDRRSLTKQILTTELQNII